MRCHKAALFVFLLCSGFLAAAPDVRIKDVATLGGVRENQLLGVGLVTGLSGKGDSSGSVMLKKTMSNLMASFGIDLDPADIKSRNCAVVMVSSEVPSFARPGERIDLTVSSIGDARSLEGGVLLQTNLRGANGLAYAVGQGSVLVTSTRTRVDTVGSVSGGAIIEREILSRFINNNRVSVLLRNPDFVTASAVAEAVRQAFGEIDVDTQDASLIEITIPEDRREDVVGFIGELESLAIVPDVSGKVVIDSQSGVIIIGENVRVGTVAVSYEQVNIRVGTSAWGEEEVPAQFVIKESTKVEDLLDTLKAAELDTEVIIGVMKAIEAAGALYGRLVVL